ncbi:unnamed protein product [Hanseniaspora opuntiae]
MPGKNLDNGFSPSSSPTNKTVLIKKSGSVLVNKRSSSSKTPKERTISVFEHNLTYHVRQTLQRLDSSSTTQKTEEVKHFSLVLYSCFMIGCGTSSLYFASLISCSKFFTDSKVLSISMPTTLYGSSSVLFAYVLTHWKKLKFPIDNEKNPQGEFFNLKVVFKYMAIFYFMVIILNYLASTIVTHLKLEYELLDQETSEEIESHRPLLDASHTNYSAITDEEESEEALTTDTEDTVLVTVTDGISNNKYEENNTKVSLKDKLSLFLTNRKTFFTIFNSIFICWSFGDIRF